MSGVNHRKRFVCTLRSPGRRHNSWLQRICYGYSLLNRMNINTGFCDMQFYKGCPGAVCTQFAMGNTKLTFATQYLTTPAIVRPH